MNCINMEHISYSCTGKELWFVLGTINAVAKVNVEDRTIELERMLPSISGKFEEHRAVIKNDNSLYVIPFNAASIVVYSGDNEIRLINLNENGDIKAVGGFIRNQHMYMFGSSDIIYKVDLDNGEHNKIDCRSMADKNHFSDFFWTDYTLNELDAYLPLSGSNGVIRLDANDGVSFISLGEKREKWANDNIILKDQKFYALYKDEEGRYYSSIYALNGETINRNEVIIDRDIDIYPYTKAYMHNDQWLILPYRYTNVSRVSVKGGVVKDLEYKKVNEGDVKRLFNAYSIIDGILYSVDHLSGNLLSVNLESMKTEVVELSMPEKSNNYLRNLTEGHTSVFTSELERFLTLGDFMNYVAN